MSGLPFDEQCSIVARKIAKLSDDWHAWIFEACPPNGILVTGAVVTARITRGRRAGELNYRKADLSTKQRVFIPNEALDHLRTARPTPEPSS